MKKRYTNYYNSENINFTFIFEGVTNEEALRIQAYMLQDSHYIIEDEEVLSKISEEQLELIEKNNITRGTIYINRNQKDKHSYTIEGNSQNVDFNGDIVDLKYKGNIYEGLNFIAVVGHVKDEETKQYKFSEINWYYDKNINPTKLIRSNIKVMPLTQNVDYLDLEDGDIIYEVDKDFNIKDNPTKIFKNSKKEIKVKKK